MEDWPAVTSVHGEKTAVCLHTQNSDIDWHFCLCYTMLAYEEVYFKPSQGCKIYFHLFQDPYNRVTYSIIGDDLAQNRFSIDQSGIIRTTTGIQGDNSDYYIVSIS